MIPFRTAILRIPPDNAGSGLTSANLGSPDPALLASQHARYRETLESLGLEVVTLKAEPDFPDSYFPEDVAVVVPEIAVLARPGAIERRGEPALIEPVLARYRKLERIAAPGTLDGGDVLVIGDHCIVGLSARTNLQGARQLAGFLSVHGYRTDIVEVDEGLHLKSSVNALDDTTVLATQAMAGLDCLDGYRKFQVPEGEDYAANVVAVNRHILAPERFDGTRRMLENGGYDVVVLPVSEIRKMDGGLSCLSLRLT
ncbi:MAG: amidinotransferase [Gammaproteobacteria bacterium]|nr:amidinotransferase [Gammaproteobacteria bacterium]MYD75980.1 amidinotransferase [Gammaproteobacteria bacterium]MYJ51831.1 amidinotransferase [Gammaproteobacteria bacterium]